jgi:Prolipoprotein diacylglyceryl transferase
MLNEIFTLILGAAIALLFAWAFRTLPKEDWQIMACLPYHKGPDGDWLGRNLTYYGFFSALAYVFAVIMFLIMMGALNIPFAGTISVVVVILAVCLLAARLIARWVEKKPHTFSVGAASFTGIVIGPPAIWVVNLTIGKWLGFYVPTLSAMTTIFIAYAFGEGIGRLACISFGCCYGKQLADCNSLIKKIFRKHNFVFYGKTKKITYAHQLDGQEVIPIQALTAVIYCGTGLLSFYLFLNGHTFSALIIILIVTQGWRFASEFLRADYRGNNRISAYQIMTLIAIIYTFIVAALIKQADTGLSNLLLGINSLWNPGIIIFLIVLWIAVFLYTGLSHVTNSVIEISVINKNT